MHVPAVVRNFCVLGAAIAAGAQTQNLRADVGGRAWATHSAPTAGPARSIGRHANGCIAGAVALPLDGPGYTVIRPQRNRFWGHPTTIAFIKALGRHVQRDAGRTLMIADIGQPRGGPVAGHASHKVGLDADIRFLLVQPGRLTAEQRADPPEVSALNADRTALNRAVWGPVHIRLIRAAAGHPSVDRIFVNPAIKRALCRAVRGDRRWLRKVRAWYGHHAHMHVRLRCPPDSPRCVAPRALPPGSGCGKSLAWWFTSQPFQRRLSGAKPVPPKLPKACQPLLK